MQIVIDVPDRIYKIVQNKTLNIIDSEIVEKAITNGTPLDDIRAEIENLKYEADIIMYGIAIDDVLQIIDRHREEAET